MNIKIFFIWCISLLFTFILNTNLTQAAWLIETVDVSPNSSFMTDRSIAIANTGIVHIAYGGDHLYHAYRDGNWHVEIVDSSDQVGQHASLSLDSLGNVHISYYDAVNGALKYATNASGSWQLETVDNGGNVEGYISVSLDSADKVHISYIGRGLKYATNSTGSWAIERDCSRRIRISSPRSPPRNSKSQPSPRISRLTFSRGSGSPMCSSAQA